MRPIRSLLLAFATALCACRGGPLEPGERRELDRARARWEAHKLAEYTYEARMLCFCNPATAVWSEVHVRGDSVVAVIAVDPLPSGASQTRRAEWLTVPGLFAAVELYAGADVTRDVEATYDDDFGYPRSIHVTCTPNVTDCGVVYEARNLRPIR